MQISTFDQYEHQFEHSIANEFAGFTIMETCVAMLIMFIAVLGSATLFVYSIHNNSGANDRELAMAVAQQQMEQLRNVPFVDASLDETSQAGVLSTITRAGRAYEVLTVIRHSNVVNTRPTVKTITIQVNPTGTSLGAVTVRTIRTTHRAGPNR